MFHTAWHSELPEGVRAAMKTVLDAFFEKTDSDEDWREISVDLTKFLNNARVSSNKKESQSA